MVVIAAGSRLGLAGAFDVEKACREKILRRERRWQRQGDRKAIAILAAGALASGRLRGSSTAGGGKTWEMGGLCCDRSNEEVYEMNRQVLAAAVQLP